MLRSFLHVLGVVVGLEFVFTGKNTHSNGDKPRDRLEEDKENNQANVEGNLLDFKGTEESSREG